MPFVEVRHTDRLSSDSWVYTWQDPGMTQPASATFLDYMRFPSYRNIAARMLGNNELAYQFNQVSQIATDAAMKLLRCMPVVSILEDYYASSLLFAHTFSHSVQSCATTWNSIVSTASVRVNHHIPEPLAKLWEQLLPLNGTRTVITELEELNALDIQMYDFATHLMCSRWKAAAMSERSCFQLVLGRAGVVSSKTEQEQQRQAQHWQSLLEVTMNVDIAAGLERYDSMCFGNATGWRTHVRAEDGSIEKRRAPLPPSSPR